MGGMGKKIRRASSTSSEITSLVRLRGMLELSPSLGALALTGEAEASWNLRRLSVSGSEVSEVVASKAQVL